ncbi:hypothetical protein ACW95P_02465 [Candidatus Mycoplasma pogonae]
MARDLQVYFTNDTKSSLCLEKIRTMFILSFFLPFGTVIALTTQNLNISALPQQLPHSENMQQKSKNYSNQ